MIQAHELRIGNYVEDRFDVKNIQIRPLDIDDFTAIANYQRSNHPFPYMPVSLTPDILLKCGAVKDIVSGWNFELMDGSCRMLEIEKWSTIEKYSFSFVGSDFISNCKYVHQLQNLYFVLTGEDLKIQL